MKLFERISNWCNGKNSLFVKIFPTAAALLLSWGGVDYLKTEDYGSIVALFIVALLLALLLVFMPDALFENQEIDKTTGHPKFSNLTVLGMELLLLVVVIGGLLKITR